MSESCRTLTLSSTIWLSFIGTLYTGFAQPAKERHAVPSNTPLIGQNDSLRDIVIKFTTLACSKKAFCNESLSDGPKVPCFKCHDCFCDDNCSFYGDCCSDKLFAMNKNEPSQPSPHVACLNQHAKWATYGSRHVFMINSCPANTTVDEMTRLKCDNASLSDLQEATPVTTDMIHITYRNMYCALCHGVYEYSEWRHSVECRKPGVLSSTSVKDELWRIVIQTPSCKVTSYPPTFEWTRECLPKAIGYCGNLPEHEERTMTLCHLYSAPVNAGPKLYKNIFCAACNGAFRFPEQNCISGRIEPRHTTYPLSVLMDFNPTSIHQSARMMANPTTQTCPSTELFDPISKSCQKVQCSRGRALSGEDCDFILNSVSGLGYSGSMTLTFSEKVSLNEWQTIIKQWASNLEMSLSEYDPFSVTKLVVIGYTILTRENGLFHLTVSGAAAEFDFVSDSRKPALEFEEKLRQIHTKEVNLTVGRKNGVLISTPLPCGLNGDQFQGDQIDILRMEESLLNIRTCRQNRNFCSLEKIKFVSILSMMNCPHIVFNVSETNITINAMNSTLEIDNHTIQLNDSEYLLCGNTIKICVDELRRIRNVISQKEPQKEVFRSTESSALTIVSVAAIALSLVSLVLTFIVYCLLPQLRTLPGKNTMVLVTYLFSAQLLFQAGIRLTANNIVCQAMGVVIHFLWMATFFSMGVCAFHMYTVFTGMLSKIVEDKQSETKKLFRYIIVCNLLAAAVVAICIVYNGAKSHGLELGYGGRICFLAKPLDIGVFFAAPLGAVLVFNMFCFVRVVVAIRSVPNMTTSKNQSNRNHLTVYVRLSALLGFTWTVGFIAAILQLDVLWYIFVILNGLQGVFIFVAYCLRRAIWNMLVTSRLNSKSDSCNSSIDVNSPTMSTQLSKT